MENEVLARIDSDLALSEDRPKSDMGLLTRIITYMNANVLKAFSVAPIQR